MHPQPSTHPQLQDLATKPAEPSKSLPGPAAEEAESLEEIASSSLGPIVKGARKVATDSPDRSQQPSLPARPTKPLVIKPSTQASTMDIFFGIWWDMF